MAKKLKSCYKLVLSFEERATTINLNYENKRINAFTDEVEQIYYSRNLNTINAFPFQRNLVAYILTYSRKVVQLHINWEGSGDYTTLLNMLLDPASPLRCPINTNIIKTVNNNR